MSASDPPADQHGPAADAVRDSPPPASSDGPRAAGPGRPRAPRRARAGRKRAGDAPRQPAAPPERPPAGGDQPRATAAPAGASAPAAANGKPHAAFLREVLTGAAATLVASALAVLAARMLGGDAEFSVDMFSPYAFVESVRSLVLELSTQDGRLLLAAGGALLALTAVISVLWLRADPTAEPEGWRGRLRAELCNGRTATGVGLFALIALGAFAYQWYLWERVLPFAPDDTGIVFARTLDAPPLEQSVDALMLAQGRGARVTTKEFPLRRIEWEPAFLERMRAIGVDLGADAVVLYDQTAAGDDAEWAATLMFTEPDLGLVLGQQANDPTLSAQPDAGADPGGGAGGSVKPDQPNPVLRGVAPAGGDRRKAAADLVYAALGVLAYREDRFAEASTLFDQVDPDRMGLLNPGVIDFYRGNAYLMQERWLDAEAAYERADAFYAAQGDGALRPQDRLIHAKVRTERGILAMNVGEWNDALGWYAGATDLGPGLRADVAAGAPGLDPADVHGALARVYGLRSDVHRRLGEETDARAWREEGAREIALLDAAVAGNPDRSPVRLIENARSLAALGSCTDAAALLEEALRDPAATDDVALGLELTWLHRLNYRNDLARASLARVAETRPDSARVWLARAGFLRLDRGIWGLLSDPALVIYDDNELNSNFYEPDAMAEAELMYRRVLGLPPFAANDALDPDSAAAYRGLADLAAIRFDAARYDLTALLSRDDTTLAKSAILFPRDPERRAAALDALDEAISHRMAIQNRLAAGDADNAGWLSFLWNQRAEFLIQIAADDRSRLGLEPDADRDRDVLGALAESQRWARVVLDDPAAPTSERLEAWNNLLSALVREIAWHAAAPDGATAAEASRATLRAAYRTMTAETDALDAAGLSAGLAATIANNLSWIDATSRAFADTDIAAARERQAEYAALAEEDRRQDVIHAGSACAGMDEVHAAWAAQGEHDYEAALLHAEDALAAAPDHPEALNVLGVSQVQLGDYEAATATFKRAAEVSPTEPTIPSNLGITWLLRGDRERADAAFAGAFRLLDGERPQRTLAFLRTLAADVDLLMRRQPETVDALLPAVGIVAAYLDDAEAAIGPAGGYEYPALYARLGRVALDAGDPALAERLLRRSLALDPHQPPALTALALAAVGNGRDPERETAALLRELYAPFWRTSTLPAGSWTPRLMQQLNVHGRRFPDQAGSLDAIKGALEAPGLDDWWTAYTDPAYGYRVPLPKPWGWSSTRLTAFTDDDFLFGVWNDDGSQRDKGASDAMEAYGGDPAACVAGETNPANWSAASAAPVGADDERFAGESADAAWRTVELRDDDGNETSTVSVRCQVLLPGSTVLVLHHLTWDAYDADRAALRDEMFAGIEIPAEIDPPVAAAPPLYVPDVTIDAAATPVAGA